MACSTGKHVFQAFGLAGSASWGSMIENAGVDDEEVLVMAREKAAQRAAVKAGTVGEGLKLGFSRAGDNFMDGLRGAVNRPLEGAKKDGVQGFFKGMGSGALGLLTKPVAGVMAIGETLADRGAGAVLRVRAPRAVYFDARLRPFDATEAAVFGLGPGGGLLSVGEGLVGAVQAEAVLPVKASSLRECVLILFLWLHACWWAGLVGTEGLKWVVTGQSVEADARARALDRSSAANSWGLGTWGLGVGGEGGGVLNQGLFSVSGLGVGTAGGGQEGQAPPPALVLLTTTRRVALTWANPEQASVAVAATGNDPAPSMLPKGGWEVELQDVVGVEVSEEEGGGGEVQVKTKAGLRRARCVEADAGRLHLFRRRLQLLLASLNSS